MIFPKKHIKTSESLIGIGGRMIKTIGKNTYFLEDLWVIIQKDEKIGYDRFLFCLDFLYLIKSIHLNEKGEIKCNC